MVKAKWDLYNALSSEVGEEGIMKRFSLKELREIIKETQGRVVPTSWNKPYLAGIVLELINKRDGATLDAVEKYQEAEGIRTSENRTPDGSMVYTLHVRQRTPFGVAFNAGDIIDAEVELTEQDALALLQLATKALTEFST
jgi:hypothetical protein